MSNSKSYVLSFTTLFYKEKGYVLMFNRHKNVRHIDNFPVAFEPWNRYDALIMRDVKEGTKVKRATGIVSTKQSDFATVFEGTDPQGWLNGAKVYLSELNEHLNKGTKSMVDGSIANLEKIDFYSLVGDILDKVNYKVIQATEVAEMGKAGGTPQYGEGQEYLEKATLDHVFGELRKREVSELLSSEGEYSKLELLDLLPQYGYNQALDLAELVFKGAEMDSTTERLITIQYGSKVLDMVKANLLKMFVVGEYGELTESEQVFETTKANLDTLAMSTNIKYVEFIKADQGDRLVIYSDDPDKLVDGAGEKEYVETVAYGALLDRMEELSVTLSSDSSEVGLFEIGSQEPHIEYGDFDKSTATVVFTVPRADDDSVLASNIIRWSDGYSEGEGANHVASGEGDLMTGDGDTGTVTNSAEGDIGSSIEELNTDTIKYGATNNSALADLFVDTNSNTVENILVMVLEDSLDVEVENPTTSIMKNYTKDVALQGMYPSVKLTKQLDVSVTSTSGADFIEDMYDVVTTVGSVGDKVERTQDVSIENKEDAGKLEKVMNVTVTEREMGKLNEVVGDVAFSSPLQGNKKDQVLDVKAEHEELADREELTYDSSVGVPSKAYKVEGIYNVHVETHEMPTRPDPDKDVVLSDTELSSINLPDVNVVVGDPTAATIEESTFDVSLGTQDHFTPHDKVANVYLVDGDKADKDGDGTSYEVEINRQDLFNEVDQVKDVMMTTTDKGETSSISDAIVENAMGRANGSDEPKEVELDDFSLATVGQATEDIEVGRQDFAVVAGNNSDVVLEFVETSDAVVGENEVVVEPTSDVADNQAKNEEVVLEVPDTATSTERNSEVAVEVPELVDNSYETADVTLHWTDTANSEGTSDVILENSEKSITGMTQDVKVEGQDLAETEKTEEVTVWWQDSATTERTTDVSISNTDMATTESTSEVEINGYDLAESSETGVEVSLGGQDSAETNATADVQLELWDGVISERTSDVILEEPELATSDTFLDVVEEDIDLATLGRTKLLDVLEDEESDKRRDSLLTLEDEELAETGGSTLINIYEEEEGTPGGVTIMEVDDGEQATSTTTSYFEIEEEELSTKFGGGNIIIEEEDSAKTSKDISVVIEGEEQGITDNVYSISVDGEDEGSIDRVTGIEIDEGDQGRHIPKDTPFYLDDDDTGVGLIPDEPPWEEPQEKNKIWLIMGKNYPAWNVWNNKKTR